MALRLVYDPRAHADLDSIYDWIADQSDPETAFAYTSRLQAACERLIEFPRRGTPRDDLAPGIRTISFERRDIIAYLVEPGHVLIVGIFHHGRDVRRAFVDE